MTGKSGCWLCAHYKALRSLSSSMMWSVEGRGGEGRRGERLLGCGSFGGIQKMLFSNGWPAVGKLWRNPKCRHVRSKLARIYSKMPLLCRKRSRPPFSLSLSLSGPHHAELSLPLQPNAELSDFSGDKRTAGGGGGSRQRMRGGTAQVDSVDISAARNGDTLTLMEVIKTKL